jgi:hypothetical protein
MKKIIIAMLMSLILLAGCGTNSAAPDIPEDDLILVETTSFTEDPNSGYGGGFDIGTYRLIYYNLPGYFADLVGRDVCNAWDSARSREERDNECIAVSFIRDFNISKEDFIKANEEIVQIWAEFEAFPGESSSFELYPIDLIFTFDNERINYYFLWENSPVAKEFGMGMENGRYRHLFYNMPAPFVNLVDRNVFLDWKRARSDEERENEAIAISFIRDFKISKEDFNRANEEMRQIWAKNVYTPEESSWYEVYPVELLFSASPSSVEGSRRIKEYFLWENSPAANERIHMGQGIDDDVQDEGEDTPGEEENIPGEVEDSLGEDELTFGEGNVNSEEEGAEGENKNDDGNEISSDNEQ